MSTLRCHSFLGHASRRLFQTRCCSTNSPEDETTLKGWVKRCRFHGRLVFLDVTDGLSPGKVQVVLHRRQVPKSKDDVWAKINDHIGVEVRGKIVDSIGPDQDTELSADSFKAVGFCNMEEFPLAVNCPESWQRMRALPHLRSMAPRVTAVMRMRHHVRRSAQKFFDDRDFIYVDTPTLTPSDCEGGGEVFQVQSGKLQQQNTGHYVTRSGPRLFGPSAKDSPSAQSRGRPIAQVTANSRTTLHRSIQYCRSTPVSGVGARRWMSSLASPPSPPLISSSLPVSPPPPKSKHRAQENTKDSGEAEGDADASSPSLPGPISNSIDSFVYVVSGPIHSSLLAPSAPDTPLLTAGDDQEPLDHVPDNFVTAALRGLELAGAPVAPFCQHFADMSVAADADMSVAADADMSVAADADTDDFVSASLSDLGTSVDVSSLQHLCRADIEVHSQRKSAQPSQTKRKRKTKMHSASSPPGLPVVERETVDSLVRSAAALLDDGWGDGGGGDGADGDCDLEDNFVLSALYELQRDRLSQRPSRFHRQLRTDQALSLWRCGVVVGDQEARLVERLTHSQSGSASWMRYRQERITASNFGVVCRRRFQHPPTHIVASILGRDAQDKPTDFYQGWAMQWGKDNEHLAIRRYEKLRTTRVRSSGLVINPALCWLGASPDGLVFDYNEKKAKGLVEIKCPYKYRFGSISDVCDDRNQSLERVDGTPRLKRGHPYYYQIMGQLAVTQRGWCDYIVFTCRDIHVERVYFDDALWQEMLASLTNFFFGHLAPRLPYCHPTVGAVPVTEEAEDQAMAAQNDGEGLAK